MSKLSIAAQLAAIQKQKDLLAKKEAALKAESQKNLASNYKDGKGCWIESC